MQISEQDFFFLTKLEFRFHLSQERISNRVTQRLSYGSAVRESQKCRGKGVTSYNGSGM